MFDGIWLVCIGNSTIICFTFEINVMEANYGFCHHIKLKAQVENKILKYQF